MSTSYRNSRQAVRDALSAHGGKVNDLGGDCWELTVGGGAGDVVGVHMQAGCVSCSLPLLLGGGSADRYERVLSAVTRLPGGCKAALYPHDAALYLREDIAIVDGVDVSRRCTVAIADLMAASAALAKRRRATRRRKATPLVPDITAALEEACNEAGWELTRGEDGSALATMTLPPRAVRAEVTAHGKRNVRIAAPLGGYGALSAVGRRAAAVLLLTVNGLVRFARAGIERSAGRAHALVEVPVRERPSAAVLDTALSAVAVACGLCDRELVALADPSLAQRYLDAQASNAAPALTSAAL
jgi:hypothetical protein